MKRAVFLDRDGVLNVYLPGDYAKTPDELVLLPGVGVSVQKLRDAGFLTVLISNQQGVAKGLMTPSDLDAVTAKLRAEVALDAVYYCPHLKSEDCTCRKPKPGMLLQAAQEHGIDLTQSVFIGDTPTDAQAALAAGVAFVLVLSGQSKTAEGFLPAPTVAVENLDAAVEWVLS
ncbi:MAG: HAD family hydrolase [Armatimonadetes bacterium]|nr:HAD family hydrolase [Armatimonadota bacterium]